MQQTVRTNARFMVPPRQAILAAKQYIAKRSGLANVGNDADTPIIVEDYHNVELLENTEIDHDLLCGICLELLHNPFCIWNKLS